MREGRDGGRDGDGVRAVRDGGRVEGSEQVCNLDS